MRLDPEALEGLRRELPWNVRVAPGDGRVELRATRPWLLLVALTAALAVAATRWPYVELPRLTAFLWAPLYTVHVIRLLLGELSAFNFHWRRLAFTWPDGDYRLSARAALEVDGRRSPLDRTSVLVEKDPSKRLGEHAVWLLTDLEEVRVGGFRREARARALADALAALIGVEVRHQRGTTRQILGLRTSLWRAPEVGVLLLLQMVVGTACSMVATLAGTSWTLAFGAVAAVLLLQGLALAAARRRIRRS